jgi:hypothetical protein
MATNQVERNTRLVSALDEILDSLSFDVAHPIKVLKLAEGKEVVVVQSNAFTISRIYTSGRPDGKRPHGRESYYEYFCEQLEDYKQQHGSDEGFGLTPEDWRVLFRESYDRYTRYLLFAGIKRWADVKRDTDTNLAVTNMGKQYAPPDIAWESYQYKGYILMMNSMANAELCLMEDDHPGALDQVNLGIQHIGKFCGECLRENYGDAENVTRERYLSNLIEFRSDLESVEEGLDRRRESDEDEDDDVDFLEELEELLDEGNTN